MKRIIPIILTMLIALSLVSCEEKMPESVVMNIIEPYRDLGYPLNYFETRDNFTAIYKIPDNTAEIEMYMFGIENFHAFGSSSTSDYLLTLDRDGMFKPARIESDWDITTDVDLTPALRPIEGLDWHVGRNDIITLAGQDSSGDTILLRITFHRKEPEESFSEDVINEPEITWETEEWYRTGSTVQDFRMSHDGTTLALLIAGPENSVGHNLYIINEPGAEPESASEYPVFELGGFSPDDTSVAFTAFLDQRVNLFETSTDTLETTVLARVAIGYICGHPEWHPNGKYIFYTVDYTQPFSENSITLTGEQLFMYSLVSGNSVRLTAYEDITCWVEFAPNGDFLLFESNPGIIERESMYSSAEDEQVDESQYETWRIYYVPWSEERFISSRTSLLAQDEYFHLLSWSFGPDTDQFSFMWGI